MEKIFKDTNTKVTNMKKEENIGEKMRKVLKKCAFLSGLAGNFELEAKGRENVTEKYEILKIKNYIGFKIVHLQIRNK